MLPVTLPPLAVSLAVEVIDGKTDTPIAEPPVIEIDGKETDYHQKSETIFLFLNTELPETPTPVRVSAGEKYRPMSKSVLVTTEADPGVDRAVFVRPPSNPSLTFDLYPPDSTVLRGLVRNPDGTVVTDATITTPPTASFPTTAVDDEGRFVLEFENVEEQTSSEFGLTLPNIKSATVSVELTAGTVTEKTFVVKEPGDTNTPPTFDIVNGIT